MPCNDEHTSQIYNQKRFMLKSYPAIHKGINDEIAASNAPPILVLRVCLPPLLPTQCDYPHVRQPACNGVSF